MAAAIEQIEQGFAVFALRSDAKVPVTEHGFKNATTRPDWIRRQLEARPRGTTGWSGRRPRPSASSCSTSTTAAVRIAPGAIACSTSSRSTGPCRQRRSRRRPRAAATPSTAGRPTFRSPPATSCSASRSAGRGRGYLVGPGSRIGDREYTAGPVTEIAELPEQWVEAALAERPAQRRKSADPGVITVAAAMPCPTGSRAGAATPASATTWPAATTRASGSTSSGSSCALRSPRGSRSLSPRRNSAPTSTA